MTDFFPVNGQSKVPENNATNVQVEDREGILFQVTESSADFSKKVSNSTELSDTIGLLVQTMNNEIVSIASPAILPPKEKQMSEEPVVFDNLPDSFSTVVVEQCLPQPESFEMDGCEREEGHVIAKKN